MWERKATINKHKDVTELASVSYLLVVQFLGLPRFEELQQVPQCSLIVVSERIPWTVPVPGHHTTRQGGRMTKREERKMTGEEEDGVGGEKKEVMEERGGKKSGKWTRRGKREREGEHEGKMRKFRDAEWRTGRRQSGRS